MPKINKNCLETLYKASEIQKIWQSAQNLDVIEHPSLGALSPVKYRLMHDGKPCCYCGKKMVHGQKFSTHSRECAIADGYQYLDNLERKIINNAGNLFFHPNYATLDHILNKARFPEKMFEFENLQVICWKCNKLKADNNSFDLEQTQIYLDSLVEETLKRFCIRLLTPQAKSHKKTSLQ